MKNFGEKTKRWFKSLFVQTDGNEPKMLTFVKKEGTQTVISSILCALLGIFLGYLILVCINAENAGKAMATILKNFGYYTSPEKQLYYFGSTLVKSVPLIMCGLSVMLHIRRACSISASAGSTASAFAFRFMPRSCGNFPGTRA